MTEYPKYIIDEAERRMTVSALGFPVKFNCDMHAHRVIVDLPLESGFKPPVDPLLEEIWSMCGKAHFSDDSFHEFVSALGRKGLTVTVTKAGDV